MLESKIQPKIIKYLEKQGAYVIRNIVCSKAGKHDLTVCYKSKFISFEVKNETYEPSPLQVYNVKKIQKAGGKAYIVRSVSEVREILKTITCR